MTTCRGNRRARCYAAVRPSDVAGTHAAIRLKPTRMPPTWFSPKPYANITLFEAANFPKGFGVCEFLQREAFIEILE